MKSRKQVIRLNESQLNRIIKESVKRVLNEGGDLYWHDEDGTPCTTSQTLWRNVPETTFIWHGEWSVPEIWYKGHELNSNDVEECIWDTYAEECEENGEHPTEEGYEEWIEERGTSWLQAELDDIIYGMDNCY